MEASKKRVRRMHKGGVHDVTGLRVVSRSCQVLPTHVLRNIVVGGA
jgi:hypothetical protein